MDIFLDYLPEMVSILLICISLIFQLFSGKTNTIKVLSSYLDYLPTIINSTENRGLIDGQSKKSYATDLSITYLSSKLGKSTNYVIKHYGNFIDNKIEEVLSTPQKKEV